MTPEEVGQAVLLSIAASAVIVLAGALIALWLAYRDFMKSAGIEDTGMIKRFKNWLWLLRVMHTQRVRRKDHNDRDFKCRYWWGDRGGYLLTGERCAICNRRGAE